MAGLHAELLEGEAVDLSCVAQGGHPAPRHLTWDRRTEGGQDFLQASSP